MNTRRCPYCAFDVSPGTTTCGNCGGPIPADSALDSQPTSQSSTPFFHSPHSPPSPPFVASPGGTSAKHARPGVVIALLIVLVVSGVGFWLVLSGDSDSSQHSGPPAAVEVQHAIEEPIASPTPDPTGAQPATPLTDPEARAKATQFYSTRSEWAGQYSISITSSRIDFTGPNTATFHAQYNYTCIQRRCGGGRTGQDQRTFFFLRQGAQWVVTHEGGHMSATF